MSISKRKKEKRKKNLNAFVRILILLAILFGLVFQSLETQNNTNFIFDIIITVLILWTLISRQQYNQAKSQKVTHKIIAAIKLERNLFIWISIIITLKIMFINII